MSKIAMTGTPKVAIVQLTADSNVRGSLWDIENPSVRKSVFEAFRKAHPEAAILSVAKVIDDPGTITYQYAFTYVEKTRNRQLPR